MSIRKTLALAGTLIVFAAGLAVAQEQTQDKNKVRTEAQVKAQTQTKAQVQAQTQDQDQTALRHRNRAKTAVQSKAQAKARLRMQFIDQDGDGINDAFRDADGDGVPNCQDPDWAPPQDGTGYQAKAGQAKQFKGANGSRGGQALSNASFRNSLAGPYGTGICDGTGPKGRAVRKGRG